MRHLKLEIDDLFTPTASSETTQRVIKQSSSGHILTGSDINYVDWLWRMKCIEFFDIKFDIEASKIPLNENVSAFIERLSYVLDNFRDARFSETIFYFEKDAYKTFDDPVIERRYTSPNIFEERHWQWCGIFPSMDVFFRFVLIMFKLTVFLNGNPEGTEMLKNKWFFSFYPLTTDHDRTRINFDEFMHMLNGSIMHNDMFPQMKRMLSALHLYESVSEDDIKDFFNNYHGRRKTVRYGRPVLSDQVGHPFRNYQRC